MARVDIACTSAPLELAGACLVFVGIVITGAGLFIGWRRAQARQSQRRRELRAALDRAQYHTADAALRVQAGLSAIVTAVSGPDVRPEAPISRSQLTEAIGSLQREIQNVANSSRDEMREVRRAVAEAVESGVTNEGVEATTRSIVAEQAHRDNAITLRDLSYALAGIMIQGIGTLWTGLGIIAGL